MRAQKKAARNVTQPDWWGEEFSTTYHIRLKEQGKVVAERWKKRQYVLHTKILPEKKLKAVFDLVNVPLSQEEEEVFEQAQRWVTLYTNFDRATVDQPMARDGQITGYIRSPLAPSAPVENWQEWVPALWQETRQFLENFYNALITNGNNALLPAVHYAPGIRYSLVKDGKVVHRYRNEDATSAFLLTLGDLLAGLDDLSRIRRCICGNFFLRTRRQEYCRIQCTRKAHPSRERTRESRERKVKWKKVHQRLGLLLTDIDAITHKRKLQQPRSERQVLEEAEKAFNTAEEIFIAAYPRKKGLTHEEGKVFLAHANNQIKRFRKRVRGY